MRQLIFRFGACLLVAVLALCEGCMPVSSEQNLVGRYKLSADWGCSTLDLREDHSFTQTVSRACTGNGNTITGTWKGEELRSTFQAQLNLQPYINVTTDGPTQTGNYGYLSIERWLWGTQIVVDPDKGLKYRKQ